MRTKKISFVLMFIYTDNFFPLHAHIFLLEGNLKAVHVNVESGWNSQGQLCSSFFISIVVIYLLQRKFLSYKKESQTLMKAVLCQRAKTVRHLTSSVPADHAEFFPHLVVSAESERNHFVSWQSVFSSLLPFCLSVAHSRSSANIC